MNWYKKIIIAAFLPLVISCGNKFLDVDPVLSMPESEVLQDMNDLENSLNGAYQYLKFYRSSGMYIGDLMGEDFMNPTYSGHLSDYYDYKYSKNSCPTAAYKRLYKSSFHINSMLEKAPAVDDGSDRYKEIIAEFRFVRALIHFETCRYYGPLPGTLGEGKIKVDALGIRITKEVPDNIRKPFYRDKVSDVYDFIISEMENSVNILPKTKKPGYFNYYAGKALMARVYLYHEDWDKALACAEEVIKNGGYELYERDKYEEAWKAANTSESIFEIPSSEVDNEDWSSLGYYADSAGYAAVTATLDFVDLMKADPDDIRFNLLVYDHKYKVYRPMGKYPGREGNKKVCNAKVLRLSEMYLIAAEALFKKPVPDIAGAGKYLSDLREKRSLKDSRKYDNHINMEDILYERRVELFCESHRCWDVWRNLGTIVRWTTPDEKDEKGHYALLGKIEFDNYKAIWPLSIEEIDLMAPADRVKQQNPGY